MSHIALVHTAAPKTSTTDTRLLKVCRRYLLELQHLGKLRQKQAEAQTLANAVFHHPPTDPEAAALWRQCWAMTPASCLSRGIAWSEKTLAELLVEISETPACTERGLRARLEVFRCVLAQDDADRLLDSIVTDFRSRRRARA